MSFSLTTEQVRRRTKTVTRRFGWRFLKPGDLLRACAKCRGLKPGEKVERLGVIRVVSSRLEPLSAILKQGQAECDREGFPLLSPRAFVRMFCDHMGGPEDQTVSRIEFEYVDAHGNAP